MASVYASVSKAVFDGAVAVVFPNAEVNEKAMAKNKYALSAFVEKRGKVDGFKITVNITAYTKDGKEASSIIVDNATDEELAAFKAALKR